MSILISILAFFVAIGILVTVHEFGHYWVAKRLGVKVLTFSLGFGKPLYQWRRGETVWQIAMLPLGGYVKLLGETSLDHDEIDPVDLPRAFNRQRPWVKMAIALAGPLANLLLAWLLLTAAYMLGVETTRSLIGAVKPASPAEKVGVQVGDEIIRLDGKAVEDWEGMRLLTVLRDAADGPLELVLRRTNSEFTVRFDPQYLPQDSKQQSKDVLLSLGLSPVVFNMYIDSVVPGKSAQQAGLQPGDRLLTVDGRNIDQIESISVLLAPKVGQEVPVQVLRQGKVLSIPVKPYWMEDSGVRRAGLGVQLAQQVDDDAWLDKLRLLHRYGPIEALTLGGCKAREVSVLTLRLIGRMVVGRASSSQISGPVGIAKYAGQSAEAGVSVYLFFLAMLSVSLGILNLLPVPVLDGGHLLYHTAELIRGRPLPEWLQNLGLRVGVSLLILLMGLALFNDVFRRFIGG